MKPKIKNCRYIFGVLLLGILIWLGLLVKNHLEFQHEMVQIVHSKEVEKIIEAELKELDPNALTPKGKIQSYEINDETIEHNPMGTIDSDLAGKFSNSVKEGVGRKKLELNALQEFCKTK